MVWMNEGKSGIAKPEPNTCMYVVDYKYCSFQFGITEICTKIPARTNIRLNIKYTDSVFVFFFSLSPQFFVCFSEFFFVSGVIDALHMRAVALRSQLPCLQTLAGTNDESHTYEIG